MGICEQQFAHGTLARELCLGTAQPVHQNNSVQSKRNDVSSNATVKITPRVSSAAPCRSCGAASPVGSIQAAHGIGPGSRLIEIFKATGFEACDACYELAAQMDRWGISGCESNLEAIVADILPRALAWEAEKVGWWAKLMPESVTETAIHLIVEQAILSSKPLEWITETPTPAIPLARRPSARRRLATDFVERPTGLNPMLTDTPNLTSFAMSEEIHFFDGNSPSSPEVVKFRDSLCGTCSANVRGGCQICNCPLQPNVINSGKIRWRSESCPVGKWFRQTEKSQPLINPIRNLVFHIFPRVDGEWNWHRHVQHIRDNDSVWNGRRIISIGTGDGLVSPETVQKQFDGIRVDEWVVIPNHPRIGETEPFMECVKRIASHDPNEMTFLAHTKGITHTKDSKESLWSEMMWEVCMDLQSVDDSLQSHSCAGPFKRHMRLLKSHWHYSGHFCWIRHKDVFANPAWAMITQQRAGMEAWLGSFIPNNDAACLFLDNPPIGFLDASYWANEVIPKLKLWKETRCSVS